MNKTIRKKLSMVLVAVMALFYGFANFASASNDNYVFDTIVKPYWLDNYNPGGRFRDTTHTNNPWKVNLRYSGEGRGTLTDFWLENRNDTRVTNKETVKQGVGAHYFKAYASASQTKVWLMCENNNFNGETYRITGYWDEETWD